jgi:hypothetical protein
MRASYLVWFIVFFQLFSFLSPWFGSGAILTSVTRLPGGVGTSELRLEKSHVSGSVAERNTAVHRLFPLLKLGSQDSTLRK